MPKIRSIITQDKAIVSRLLSEHWGAPQIVSRGQIVDASTLPGFVAVGDGGEILGLVTLKLSQSSCEVVTLDAFSRGNGIGKTLMAAAIEFARGNGAKRCWLITTNDNVDALGFYQKVGMRIVAVHHNAIEEARKLKPQIPLLAENGIPIRDEIELEILL